MSARTIRYLEFIVDVLEGTLSELRGFLTTRKKRTRQPRPIIYKTVIIKQQ